MSGTLATARSGTPAVSRRLLLAASLVPIAGAQAMAQAQQKPSAENVAKVGCWMVGGQLGLAALVYFRHTGKWEEYFGEAKFRAKEIGIEVKDFPPRPPNAQEGLIKLLEFISKGDGARLANDIRRKHGAYHSALYEVSVRMFHMPLIYDLDPALADKIADLIRTKFTVIGLPDRLWKPSTNAVAKRAGFQNVRAAVVQMHGDVMKYLISVARGEAG